MDLRSAVCRVPVRRALSCETFRRTIRSAPIPWYSCGDANTGPPMLEHRPRAHPFPGGRRQHSLRRGCIPPTGNAWCTTARPSPKCTKRCAKHYTHARPCTHGVCKTCEMHACIRAQSVLDKVVSKPKEQQARFERPSRAKCTFPGSSEPRWAVTR